MELHFLFVGNVAAHWVALMSGIASVIVATYETIKGKAILARSFWAVALVCLMAACDRAWQDEHRNTQVVIAEKSSTFTLYEQCRTNAAIEAAYTRGLEGSGIKQRSTIDDLQEAASKTQATINSCVVSLGKLNPKVREVSKVLVYPVGESKDPIPIKNYGFLFIITNNEVRPDFHGYLKCEKSFVPREPPSIFTSGSTMISSQYPKKISDSEWEIKVNQTGLEWGPNSPAFMPGITHEIDLGNCLFTSIQ